MKKFLIVFVVMAMILPLVFSLGGCGQEPVDEQNNNELVQQTKSIVPTEESWSKVGIESTALSFPKTTKTTTQNVPEAKTEFGQSELSLCFNNAKTTDFNKMMNQCYKNMNAKCDSEGKESSMANFCSYNAGLGCYVFDSCYIKDDNQLYNVCLNYYEKDCTVNGLDIEKGTMTLNVYNCQKTVKQNEIQDNANNNLINENTTNNNINNDTINNETITDDNTNKNTDLENNQTEQNNTNDLTGQDNTNNLTEENNSNNQTEQNKTTDNQTEQNITENQNNTDIANDQTIIDNQQEPNQLPQVLTDDNKVINNDNSQILPAVPTLPQEDNLVNGNSDAPVLETPTENTNPEVSNLPTIDEKPLVEPAKRRITRTDTNNTGEQPINKKLTYEERRQKLLERQEKIRQERLARQNNEQQQENPQATNQTTNSTNTTTNQTNNSNTTTNQNENKVVKPTRVIDRTRTTDNTRTADDTKATDNPRRTHPVNPRTTLPIPARNTNLG